MILIISLAPPVRRHRYSDARRYGADGGKQHLEFEARTSPNFPIIGLDADLSSAIAETGRAFQRGIELAITEINTVGGVLDDCQPSMPVTTVATRRGLTISMTSRETRTHSRWLGRTPVVLAELEIILMNANWCSSYPGRWDANY